MPNTQNIHPTESDLLEKVQANTFGTENPGWCVNCGDWTHDSCEPDAHNYQCEECAHNTVYGAAEMLIRGWYTTPKIETSHDMPNESQPNVARLVKVSPNPERKPALRDMTPTELRLYIRKLERRLRKLQSVFMDVVNLTEQYAFEDMNIAP